MAGTGKRPGVRIPIKRTVDVEIRLYAVCDPDDVVDAPSDERCGPVARCAIEIQSPMVATASAGDILNVNRIVESAAASVLRFRNN